MSDAMQAEQVRDIRFRRGFDVIKAVLAGVAALAIFLLLNRPDSIVSRTASEESIARERAKMLLDVMREQDPVVRHLSFSLIASVYPRGKGSEWLDPSRKLLKSRDRYTLLQQRSGELTALLEQINRGERPAGIPADRVDRAIREEAISISRELQSIVDEFRQAGVPVPNPPRALAISCITLDAANVTDSSAELLAAPIGTPDNEWFDFDAHPQMRYSVDALRGVGKALKLAPNTKYYYRYIAQDRAGICIGDMKTLTTAPRVSCTTVGVQKIDAHSAELLGKSTASFDKAWFDFDTTKALRFSIDAPSGLGVARSLAPSTRYYYRFRVNSKGGGICAGNVLSFVTPAK